ncbi:nitric oxide synthase [Xylophilus rhododendri]|uniref:Nitric oxide synthase n=1 Tax=Xylophilus rhododendri TaxID=2697032 RepID=A0A857J0C9_9BURK|nr:flavodoxin domain-containing protein [Xylophilus rhododendri]QHI96552.1 nitric oxide synthase [Xylophilus rhododendri]
MNEVRLRILYASVSGTARLIAEALALEADTLPPGSVEVLDMHDCEASVLDPRGPRLLLCVATTGSGDIPDDGQALYQGLQLAPRFLGGLRYGLIALGDSSYGDTFSGGGLQFDAALLDLGAERVGEVLRLDAMDATEPEILALDWFRQWLAASPLKEDCIPR